MLKLLLAALLGGIAMFAWEGVAHEVLPLGQAGLRGLDNEAAVVATLKDNVKQPGFYIFPGGEMLQPGLSSAQRAEALKKVAELWKAGPSGILVMQTGGVSPDNPVMLITQCLLDILVVALAGILLSWASMLQSYGSRVLFVSIIGLVPTLNAELPYWNWYGFPSAYVLAQGLVHLVGFILAGLILAKLVKPAMVKKFA